MGIFSIPEWISSSMLRRARRTMRNMELTMSKRNNCGKTKTGWKSQREQKTNPDMCSLRPSTKSCGLPFSPIGRDASG